MNKKNTIIITIGEKGTILTIHTGKKVENKIFFEEFNEEVKKSLDNTLKKKKLHNIYVIFDTLDQSYKKKNFPSMKKSDLKVLIKREINSDADKESLRNYIILNQIDKAQNKKMTNWQVLFISVSVPKNSKELLEYINQLPNRLIGIYLAPIESANFINLTNKDDQSTKNKKQLDSDNNNSQITCLVSQTKVSGMRQTIFHKNQILFTRLLDYDSSHVDFIKKYEKDLYASYEYLKRIFPEVSIAKFKILNILSQKSIDSISKMKNIEFNIESYTPFQIAQLINKNSKINETTKDCDLVITESFINQKKENLKFTTKEMSKMQNTYLLMKVGYFANLLILVAIGILAIGSISKISKSEELVNTVKIKQLGTLNELTNSKNSLEIKEQELQEKFQDENATADEIIEIGQVNEIFEKIKTNPLKEYVKLKFLKQYNVKLDSIDYALVDFKEAEANSKKYRMIINAEIINEKGDIDDLFSKYDELKSALAKEYKDYKFSINDLPKNINLDKKYHSFQIQIKIESK